MAYCHQFPSTPTLHRHAHAKRKRRASRPAPEGDRIRLLHELLRLYWNGAIAPVVPWEMFLCYHRLKCLSIDRYSDPGNAPGTSPDLPC